MSSVDDPGEGRDDLHDHPGAESEPAPPPPLVAFACRNRLAIGLTVTAAMLGVAAWALLSRPPASVPGVYGLIQRYSFPAMSVFIAAMALTWGLKLKSVWTTATAYAAIATYLIYILVGWVYENFVV